MNPVAFELFGIEVKWYGILITLGILLGSLLFIKFAKKRGYDEDSLVNLLLVILPSSVIGARLYYVAFEWNSYKDNLLEIFNTRGGGMAIHGGIIFGAIAGYIYCKIKKYSFLDLADCIAPGLILGQAIGRWGNFINQEAHGGPTDLPWAIVVDGVKVHPTFLYESLWNIIGFIILILIINKKKFNGEIFFKYGIFYSIGRFFIEGLRTDSLYFGPIRVAQLISLSTIILFSILYFIFKKKYKKS